MENLKPFYSAPTKIYLYTQFLLSVIRDIPLGDLSTRPTGLPEYPPPYDAFPVVGV